MSASVQQWSAPAGQGLRNNAVVRLTDKASSPLDGHSSAQLDELLSTVKSRMQECEQLHWMIKGIVLRDIFTKVAKGIEKSVDLGEVVVQYDSGHAELPCPLPAQGAKATSTDGIQGLRSRHQSVGPDCRRR